MCDRLQYISSYFSDFTFTDCWHHCHELNKWNVRQIMSKVYHFCNIFIKFLKRCKFLKFNKYKRIVLRYRDISETLYQCIPLGEPHTHVWARMALGIPTHLGSLTEYSIDTYAIYNSFRKRNFYMNLISGFYSIRDNGNSMTNFIMFNCLLNKPIRTEKRPMRLWKFQPSVVMVNS